MPSRPAPTARSSSRSSKTSDGRPVPAGLRPAGPDSTAIAIGELGRPHGLRGELLFWPYQPGATSLAPGRRVLIEAGDGRGAATVRRVAAHGRALVLALDGVTDRDAAAALTGMRVLVAAADLPAPGEGEFYQHEVEGFAVVTTDGRALGTVAAIFPTGLNDVWVVRDGAREHLIPIIAEVVREIDRPGRRIVVHPMPGLLD